MDHRTCPVCKQTFTPRSWNQRYCDAAQRGPCYRKATNASYRSTTEAATCAGCGAEFSRTRGTTQRVYCSTRCHHVSKHRRYSKPENVGRCAENIFPLAPPDPALGGDAEGYIKSMRCDPCAYCGAPADTVDHIEPRRDGGLDDWTNFTGSCHRCNGRKTATPLLIFLGWDRAQREFEPWRAAVGSLHRERSAA
jgi:hypothetical protein